MTQKSHVFFAAIVSSMMLIACDSGANESESSHQTLSDITLEEGSAETAEEPILVVKKDTSAEDVTLEEPTEAPEAEEPVEATEEVSVPAEQNTSTEEASNPPVEQHQELEEVDPVIQVALQKLLEATELDKEDYRFTIEQTADYIQVEVREKQDDVAPLEGIYRYMIETEEILFSDYLTGDFVPYN